MEWTQAIVHWSVDYLATATVLIASVLVAGSVIRQPAQRMAMAWSATIALLVLAVCCAAPGWPRLAVVANAQDAEAPEAVTKPLGEEESRSAAMTVPQWMSAKSNPKVGSLEAALQRGEKAGASKDSSTQPKKSSASFDWLKFVLCSLLTGSLVSIVWLMYGQLRVWRLCRSATTAPDFAQVELRSVIGESTRQPRLLVIDAAAAGATGLWRPAILLPREAVIESMSPGAESRPAGRESLRALLANEWAHIRRGDLWRLAFGRLFLVVLFVHAV
jgi:hypothetical protein